MAPRHPRLQSHFPRKKLWPWVGLAGLLLVVGVVEVSIRAAERRALAERRETTGSGSRAESRASGAIAALPTATSAEGISGRVLLPGGAPGADVGVFTEPGGQETRTDARGAFHLDLPGGARVRVHAHHSDLGFGSAEAVTPNAAVSIVLEPRATFEVQVLQGTRPVAGAQVTAEETVERIYEADHLTDGEGRVRFRGLPQGLLRVRATLSDGARGFTDAGAHLGETAEVTVELRGP